MQFDVVFVQIRDFLGDVKRVQSEEDRKADRKTALSILAQSAMLAVAITAVVFALPL